MEKFNNFSGMLYMLLAVAFCTGIGFFIGQSFDNPILGIILGAAVGISVFIIIKPHVENANDIASDHTGDYELQKETNFLYNIGNMISLAFRAVFNIFRF